MKSVIITPAIFLFLLPRVHLNIIAKKLPKEFSISSAAQSITIRKEISIQLQSQELNFLKNELSVYVWEGVIMLNPVSLCLRMLRI